MSGPDGRWRDTTSQAESSSGQRLGHVDVQVRGAVLDVGSLRSGFASAVRRSRTRGTLGHLEPDRRRARGCPSSTRAALAPRRTSSSSSDRPAGRRCRRRSAGRRRAAAPSSAPRPRRRSVRAGWRPGLREPRLLRCRWCSCRRRHGSPVPAGRRPRTPRGRPWCCAPPARRTRRRCSARSACLELGLDDAGVPARIEFGDGRLDDGVGEKHAHSNPPSCPCLPHGSGPRGDQLPIPAPELAGDRMVRSTAGSVAGSARGRSRRATECR